MGFIIKIISSILLVIVILISIYAISRSSIIIGRIWREGIDLKATIQKLRESLTGKVNLIVLKDKMAIYKDNEIIAYILYEPNNTEETIMFPTIYHDENRKTKGT